MELTEIITQMFTNVVSVFSSLFNAANITVGGVALTFPIFVAATIITYLISVIIGGDDD